MKRILTRALFFLIGLLVADFILHQFGVEVAIAVICFFVLLIIGVKFILD